MANTEFYGKLKDDKKSVSWGDILSESFKKHDRMDRDRLLAVGTGAWKVNDGNMLSKWRKPWLWTRLLLVFIALTAVALVGLHFFSGEGIFYTLAMVMVPLALPLVELVLIWELNIPQNVSLWDIIIYFLLGGFLSLLFSIAGVYIAGSINPQIVENASIVAPLAEEPGKLIAVLIFISVVKNRNNGKIYGITGLVIGAAVGAGFSAFESIMYVLQEYGQSAVFATSDVMNGYVVGEVGVGDILNYGMSQSLYMVQIRMLSALGGHIQFAAPYAAALAYGSATGKHSGIFTLRFVAAFALSCVLHGLWNSGFGLGGLIVLILVMWSVLLHWVNKCLKEVYAAGTSPAASMPIIRWLYGPFAGQNMTVTRGVSMHIGRATGNQVVFPADTAGVSREHCVLRANPDLTIEDCGSSAGTFVDGKKLAPHTLNRLATGQRVALGSSKNSFEVM